MAKKSQKSARVPRRPVLAKLSWRCISTNEYVGIVAVIALFLIAAIVLKGPALLGGDPDGNSDAAGQAYSAPPVPAFGVDHAPPEYAPPADWDPDA